MAREKFRLAFALEDIYQGLARGEGLLTLQDEGVMLEFQVKDTLVGMMKSKLKQVVLPYPEILSVEVKSNIFRTIMILSVNRLSLLADLPNADRGEVKLKLRRKDKDMAFQIESRIQYLMSEMQLDPEDRTDIWEP
jgi:hypothetical protein